MSTSKSDKETIVIPAVTLPSLPRVRIVAPLPRVDAPLAVPVASDIERDDVALDVELLSEITHDEFVNVAAEVPLARRRETTQARALRQALPDLELIEQPPQRLPARSRTRRRSIALIRGKRLTRRYLPPAAHAQIQHLMERGVERGERLLSYRGTLAVAMLLFVLISTLTTITATAAVTGHSPLALWESATSSGKIPPPPPPDSVNPGYYAHKYGFDWPSSTLSLSPSERQRLTFMLPYAYQAAAAYDFRYHASVEPEMIVWWTHAEGIKGRINFSNCSVKMPRAGTSYFSDIENCPRANFWQLGYGNQFSTIYVLKNAFSDLYGDPNNAKLVQQVGQWVLNYDRSQGTVPTCGGYSCTFPTMTIDQIMSDVDERTGVMTSGNWWASVLSRAPGINCYMIAVALTGFSRAATYNWGGCYYAEPCWGTESNRLGDILTAWPQLRAAAHI